MDTNDSNIKPHQTGGLKLMTVFVVVLAAHVVALGGITTYYLLKGPNADADLVTTDKTHKDLKSIDGTATADSAMPDASQGDKSPAAAQTATPPAEVATIPATPSTPAPDEVIASETATPAPAPPLVSTPSLDLSAPTPSTLAPPPDMVDQGAQTPATLAPSFQEVGQATQTPAKLSPPPSQVVDQGRQTPTGPIPAELTPPAEPAPAPAAPVASGPVHMPPAAASTPVHEHEQTYTVKITDSYSKIAHAHHITVAQLKEANHIKTDVLHAGQKLVIPSARTLVTETPATSAPDTAASTSVLSESAAPMTTGLTSTTSTTGLHHHFYTVVKGDTLTKIAHKFKTTATALMTENSITDPTKLAIGKKLRIPSQESRSARNNPPSTTQPSQVQTKENAPSPQLANFVP